MRATVDEGFTRREGPPRSSPSFCGVTVPNVTGAFSPLRYADRATWNLRGVFTGPDALQMMPRTTYLAMRQRLQ